MSAPSSSIARLLEIGPAGVGELTVVERGRSFPLSLGTEGVVENLGHFLGELILKRASSAPDGERQSHDVVLLKSPADRASPMSISVLE